MFGISLPEARSALRAFVARRPSDEERRAWELTKGLVLAPASARARGSASAREVRRSAAAALVAAGGGSIEGAIEVLETWVAAKLELRTPGALHEASNAAGARGRSLVGCLAQVHGLCSAAAVARYFRRAKATLSEQMAARRASTADRQIIATPVERIVEEAAALRKARAKAAAAC